MALLKVELHAHASEDLRDRHITYSSTQLIDYLITQGYDALALTLHEYQYFPEALQRYAAERDFLLIPGVEANIEGRHTLLYNFDFDPYTLRTFQDIRRQKTNECLVIAPHPYYPGKSCLHSLLERNVDVFDAIEYCHFYFQGFNWFNDRAEQSAQRFNLPMVGTADVHTLCQVGWTYTLVESAEKSVAGIIDAVKKGRVQIVTQPLPFSMFMRCLRTLM